MTHVVRFSIIDHNAERYELLGVSFSDGKIHALLCMQQFLAAFDSGGIFAEHLAPLGERPSSMLGKPRIPQKPQAGTSIASAPPPGTALPRASRLSPPPAVPMKRPRLGIRVSTQGKGAASEREISPQTSVLDDGCYLMHVPYIATIRG